MFGIFLILIGSIFDEISTVIGKDQVEHKQETVYAMGFLNLLWGSVIFIVASLFKGGFVFSWASLPTFGPRIVLEIILSQIAIYAVCKADRSTFGFIRMLTIPLLLMVDLVIGYKINNFQLAGIGLIIFSLFIVFANKGIKKKGTMLSLATAILAVVTISLYKYDITHYNSVAAEQIIVYSFLFVYFLFATFFIGKENPFKFFRRPVFMMQSASSGAASALISWAYLFAPASVILASLRSFAVLWTIISGRIYFAEKHIIVKIICLVLLIAGIILLSFH